MKIQSDETYVDKHTLTWYWELRGGLRTLSDQKYIIDNEDWQNTDDDDDKHNEHHSDCDHDELRSKYLWWRGRCGSEDWLVMIYIL